MYIHQALDTESIVQSCMYGHPMYSSHCGASIIVFALPPSAKTSTPGPTAGTQGARTESEKTRESAGKVFQVMYICVVYSMSV